MEHNLWCRYYDDNYQCYYYVNNNSGVTQWEEPQNWNEETIDGSTHSDHSVVYDHASYNAFNDETEFDGSSENHYPEDDNITFNYYTDRKFSSKDSKDYINNNTRRMNSDVSVVNSGDDGSVTEVEPESLTVNYYSRRTVKSEGSTAPTNNDNRHTSMPLLSIPVQTVETSDEQWHSNRRPFVISSSQQQYSLDNQLHEQQPYSENEVAHQQLHSEQQSGEYDQQQYYYEEGEEEGHQLEPGTEDPDYSYYDYDISADIEGNNDVYSNQYTQGESCPGVHTYTANESHYQDTNFDFNTDLRRTQCALIRPVVADDEGDVNGKEESEAKVVKQGGGGKNQDYLHLARMYKIERPYADPFNKSLCVLCKQENACDVFFPCQHRCVCRSCIKSENICSDRSLATNPSGYCNCSLCAAVIKLILPNEGGAEVEKYWKWVYEEPVELPASFLRDFRHSAGVIETVYVNEKNRKQTNDTDKCVVS